MSDFYFRAFHSASTEHLLNWSTSITKLYVIDATNEEFPAYSLVLLRLARFFNLRTVIVTAAVYWGFGSLLLLR